MALLPAGGSTRAIVVPRIGEGGGYNGPLPDYLHIVEIEIEVLGDVVEVEVPCSTEE